MTVKKIKAERRVTDINVLEKRITIYLITLLVGVCTSVLVEMRGDFKVVSAEMAYNKEVDILQTNRMDGIEASQGKFRNIQIDHAHRLNNVEKKLEMEVEHVVLIP